MARYEDDDGLPPRQRQRRRDNLMDQRLRRSRGEEVDDQYEDYDDYDDDYDYVPHSAPRYRRAPAPAGGGCLQGALYATLGIVAVALLGVFFFSRATSSVTDIFAGVAPSMQALINTPTTTVRTNSAAVIRRVQQLNRLETTSFTIEKVIEAGVEGNPFFNLLYKDQLLLIAHGSVVAGVDLSKITQNDVSISPDGKTLTVRLPPAEILNASLDNSKTRVYRRDTAVFAENTDLETQARVAAEQEILKAACEDGILQKATNDSKLALQQFLGLADFDEVVIIPQQPAPCTAPLDGAPSATPTIAP